VSVRVADEARELREQVAARQSDAAERRARRREDLPAPGKDPEGDCDIAAPLADRRGRDVAEVGLGAGRVDLDVRDHRRQRSRHQAVAIGARPAGAAATTRAAAARTAAGTAATARTPAAGTASTARTPTAGAPSPRP